jgi:hypothetical protein
MLPLGPPAAMRLYSIPVHSTHSRCERTQAVAKVPHAVQKGVKQAASVEQYQYIELVGAEWLSPAGCHPELHQPSPATVMVEVSAALLV